MISIKNLNKYFYKGKKNEIHVIDDLSIDLPESGLVSIFGKSGCGKTTLLNTIGGLDKFNSGSIEIDGHDIKIFTDDIRNQYIGYIFQNYNLNPQETVLENVSDALLLCGLKDKKEIERRSLIALENVGMEKFKNRTPNNLSGGQMQRIAIARAIVKNPKIILADEPTGNLDETNTIMIMDLLREIANNHLVVLVTHEESLVENYCDKIIELSDGKVVNVRDNNPGIGYKKANKNDIYLGDLNKVNYDNNISNIEYYGDELNNKINIKIVNKNGKLYLQVDSNNIQLLNESSEVKLIDGKFEETIEHTEYKMTELSEIKSDNYGKLFGLKKSIISGYTQNFIKKRKKRNKLLKLCMILFTMSLVFSTAVFSVSIRNLQKVKNSYSENVFYIYANNDTYAKVLDAIEDENSGIKDMNIISSTPYVRNLVFNTGHFETFNNNNYSFSSNYVFISNKYASDYKLLYGKNKDLNSDEIVITKKIAKNLLEASNVGYISSYDDLLGLTCNLYQYTNMKLKIAGIVDCDDILVFANDLIIAKQYGNYDTLLFDDIKEYLPDITLNDGETVYISYYDEKPPAIGSTILIKNESFKVVKVVNYEDLIYKDDVLYGFNVSTGYYVNSNDYIKLSKVYYVANNDIYYNLNYFELFSNNPDLTLNYVRDNFNDVNTEYDYYKSFYTPDDMYEDQLSINKVMIIAGIAGLLEDVGLLCLCIFFIMRSALLTRVKEIGIYRAIGVKKKNIVFKFFIETMVLFTLTVVIAFVLSSTLLWIATSGSSLIDAIFYYPVWEAVLLFVLIWGICSLCGILPVIIMLGKTPSQILSKYDI